MTLPTTKLEVFIGTERLQYPGDGLNRFAFALAQACRYERFLRMIYGRHQIASERVAANNARRMAIFAAAPPGTREVGPEELILMQEAMVITHELHFEIESFYLFAKIFLDKVARFFEHNFGQVRGASLDSHDGLTKAFTKLVSSKHLIAPEAMPEVLQQLKQRIADFRDYQIAHEKGPRTIHATVWGSDQKPRLALSSLYPTEGDVQRESSDIDELLSIINRYIDHVIEFTVTNRSKSRYFVQDAEGTTNG